MRGTEVIIPNTHTQKLRLGFQLFAFAFSRERKTGSSSIIHVRPFRDELPRLISLSFLKYLFLNYYYYNYFTSYTWVASGIVPPC